MTLHIAPLTNQKTMFPFIELVNKHFNNNKHQFILCSNQNVNISYENAILKDVFKIDKELIKYIEEADHIIFHGVWYDVLSELILKDLTLFSKIYCVLWGGDFYFPETRSDIHKDFMKNVKYYVTGNISEFNLAKRYYNFEAKYIKCFTYTNNVVKNNEITKSGAFKHLNILLNHSASRTGHHIEALELLSSYKNKNIIIYVPLSYGDEEYAKDIIEYGKDLFGNKFIPITEFLEYEKYIKFLSKIDIAMFNHKIQEGASNIYTLLSMGTKVYLNSHTTVNEYMKEIGITVYDIDNFDLTLLDIKIKNSNIKATKEYFSEKNLLESLKKWM